MGDERITPVLSILRTGYKGKIGKAESYAVGAELLSDALRSLPMFDLIDLSFGYFGGSSKISATMRLVPVLSVEYRFEHWISGFVFGPGWSISVYAVPRELKGCIKASLIGGGLIEVRRWFEAKADVWGAEGRHQLGLTWDREQSEMLLELDEHTGPREAKKRHGHS
jgi:hypothetical protein